MNDQIVELISKGLERSSLTICLCFLMTNITTILVVYLKKSKIHVSHEKETCEFHREDEHAMSVFKSFRKKKDDDSDTNFRNVS